MDKLNNHFVTSILFCCLQWAKWSSCYQYFVFCNGQNGWPTLFPFSFEEKCDNFTINVSSFFLRWSKWMTILSPTLLFISCEVQCQWPSHYQLSILFLAVERWQFHHEFRFVFWDGQNEWPLSVMHGRNSTDTSLFFFRVLFGNIACNFLIFLLRIDQWGPTSFYVCVLLVGNNKNLKKLVYTQRMIIFRKLNTQLMCAILFLLSLCILWTCELKYCLCDLWEAKRRHVVPKWSLMIWVTYSHLLLRKQRYWLGLSVLLVNLQVLPLMPLNQFHIFKSVLG